MYMYRYVCYRVCVCVQIWDWDPESNTDKLLIDVDPLFFANDPSLHQLLEQLVEGGVATAGSKQESMMDTLVHWTGVVLVKLVEIAVEVLV